MSLLHTRWDIRQYPPCDIPHALRNYARQGPHGRARLRKPHAKTRPDGITSGQLGTGAPVVPHAPVHVRCDKCGSRRSVSGGGRESHDAEHAGRDGPWRTIPPRGVLSGASASARARPARQEPGHSSRQNPTEAGRTPRSALAASELSICYWIRLPEARERQVLQSQRWIGQ
jgi:hypothetical protein